MKKLILLLAIPFLTQAQFFKKDDGLAHTFSIVAIDKEAGEMAVAVQSHWFSVGNVVAWAKSGAGVVATQSFVNKSFGIRGLEMIQSGKTAEETLKTLLSDDEGREVRQVAIIDANGNVAVHTGNKCVDYAGHIKGVNYSVQSNMMLNNTVPAAMSKAFEENPNLPLAERVLEALKAAQAAGGDIRGKQSAAIRVVKTKKSDEPWNDDFVVDLRVDDHENPIKEIGRLLKVQRAYEFMNEGDLMVEVNEMEKAMNAYNAAMQMFPENLEMKYWTAITLANNGETVKATKMLQDIYLEDKNWRELTRRLPKVGLLTVDKNILKALLK
ncbi:DUF1028 domain-containing protein [Arcticibacterium luteifluviistationis]|uniref:Zn-dependent protease n=1 Tax=Arcticibacterium luteifluviistationis TaxID=1784714 RepID=A0A2Z4G753_9BACT|nr:DUF1028 domain-containing protein [Arcticibacterium luteifluviistationis]AWV96991.1 Zn-dependent protease [Arcticibacterium luteifluviistationis]